MGIDSARKMDGIFPLIANGNCTDSTPFVRHSFPLSSPGGNEQQSHFRRYFNKPVVKIIAIPATVQNWTKEVEPVR